MTLQENPQFQDTDFGLAQFDASTPDYSKISAAVGYATDRLPHVEGEAGLTLILQHHPVEKQDDHHTTIITMERCGGLIHKAAD